MVFRLPGDPGAVHRAAQRQHIKWRFPVNKQGLPNNIQNLVHQVKDYWRTQNYNALHHRQVQFEHAFQEHQGTYLINTSTVQLSLQRDVQQRKYRVFRWLGPFPTHD